MYKITNKTQESVHGKKNKTIQSNHWPLTPTRNNNEHPPVLERPSAYSDWLLFAELSRVLQLSEHNYRLGAAHMYNFRLVSCTEIKHEGRNSTTPTEIGPVTWDTVIVCLSVWRCGTKLAQDTGNLSSCFGKLKGQQKAVTRFPKQSNDKYLYLITLTSTLHVGAGIILFVSKPNYAEDYITFYGPGGMSGKKRDHWNRIYHQFLWPLN